jgi:AAHS family benzoate transporter-like MFS transporter
VADPNGASSGPSDDEDGPRIDLAAPARPRRPWWLPHFLGRMPHGLEERHVGVVGIVSLAFLFENYDLSMLSAALKQIRESYGLSPAEMSALLAWIRLGAIPAFLMLPLADRIGRRRVFLVAVAGMSVGTFVSGLAQTPIQFVVAQTVTRAFLVAATATAVVLVAEALPARHRGWGIGILGAIGTFGYGLSAILYAFVDRLPFGWRFLYFVGLAPLLLFGRFRRLVVETEHFRATEGALPTAGSFWARMIGPMRELVGDHPRRSLAVAAMAASVSAATTPAFNLVSDFVQSNRGWAPSRYSMMALLAGALGTIGNPVMGWAADRLGRRPVAVVAFGAFPLVAWAMYFGPDAWVPFVWVPFVFLLTGGNVMMRVVTSELFPTSSRNTAMGWETLHETLGAAVGFAAVGFLIGETFDLALAAVLVSTTALLGALVVWSLPETAGRELEGARRRDP